MSETPESYTPEEVEAAKVQFDEALRLHTEAGKSSSDFVKDLPQSVARIIAWDINRLETQMRETDAEA